MAPFLIDVAWPSWEWVDSLKTAGALAPFVDRQFADTVPLGYGQLTSPLDQIASCCRSRAGTNSNRIPDGTVSIR